MDLSPYRDLFVSEARKHLSTFSELIVQLEDSPNDSASIDELFRHAHSLKGMAATMNYEQVVALAHLMEDQLSRIREGNYRLPPALADILLEGVDTLSRMVSAIESGSDTHEDTTRLLGQLEAFRPETEARSPLQGDLPEEEAQESAALAPREFREKDAFQSVRIKTELLDHLVNITGELITNRHYLAESIRVAEATECHKPLQQLTTLLRSLRDEVFKARMLPFTVIAERFPRLVRDLARKQGKEVHFQLTGKEIKLDRGILEEIAEPIVHILRNAVDHGLETAAERTAAGKPGSGLITLTVIRDKEHVEIIITDDGHGMEPEELKLKAVEKGIISPEQAARMTAQEALNLVCAPGFSTATAVSDISGRGVGMDAVREAVHTLSGTLAIQSQHGQGSRFILRFPLTISIIHALIVQCGSFEIAFPLNVVTRTMELQPSDIRKESGGATFLYEGVALPLRRLRQALNLPPPAGAEAAYQAVVVCHVGTSLLAFAVDRIFGQQEIFVRPLRAPLSLLHGVSGATVTSDGRVLFVADAAALA